MPLLEEYDEYIEKLDFTLANLMAFYGGGMTLTILKDLPLDEVIRYRDFAERIQNERNKVLKKGR